MGNQQLRVLTEEEALDSLIKNAIIGDGSLWKHPECVNKKLIFTSTTKAANLILEEARGYSVLPHKFPETYVPRSERSKFRDYPVRE